MAQRFHRAMEIMGWRVPDDVEEIYEEEVVVPEPEARGFALESLPGGQMDMEFHPVSSAPSLRRIVTLRPQGFADAPQIGESFRDGIPVIMNLGDLPDAEARRLVDFAAGLIFALHGTIERVTHRVYLLSPKSVEVSSGTRSASARPFS